MRYNYQSLKEEIKESWDANEANLKNLKLLMLKYSIVANDLRSSLDKLYLFTKDNPCTS